MDKNRNLSSYSDIIDMPHHTSMHHPRMPMNNRAAQFSPFAALTGYETAIKNAQDDEAERILASEHGEAFFEDP